MALGMRSSTTERRTVGPKGVVCVDEEDDEALASWPTAGTYPASGSRVGAYRCGRAVTVHRASHREAMVPLAVAS